MSVSGLVQTKVYKKQIYGVNLCFLLKKQFRLWHLGAQLFRHFLVPEKQDTTSGILVLQAKGMR